MDNFRSRSYAPNRTQVESNGPNRPPFPSNDLRFPNKELKLKKGKSVSSSMAALWNDPEIQRKKRVAGYNVYAVEGKVKGSFRKSFRWLKERYTNVMYGWW